MVDPARALILAAAVSLLLVLVFWPGIGVLARWQRTRLNTRRILIEDALKHLYDYEYQQLTATHRSLAGALSISGDEAARLLEGLQSLELLRAQGEHLVLTDDGRAYALRVIRMHRLWERYLADETGVNETEWHHQAEVKEHQLTPEQADALAVRMGNPSYDPHGDPIPTATGEIPVKRGIALTKLQPYEHAEVVHIEDEPDVVYAQLVAQDIHPGIHIRMISIDKDKVQLEADGIENALAPIIAANVTVVPVDRTETIERHEATLADLPLGGSGRVVAISRACRGPQRRRMMDLGILPGTTITAEMRGIGGDPTAYMIRGATIALRMNQAKMIHIQRNEEKAG
ncbi:MAG: metal-dependent transcriptional regulator [Planctomycetes bacterium]|nr:metal-dependent transcriptional regulator [Planctomycetota bacterium]